MRITPEINSAGGVKTVFQNMIVLLDTVLASLAKKYDTHVVDDFSGFTVAFARKPPEK